MEDRLQKKKRNSIELNNISKIKAPTEENINLPEVLSFCREYLRQLSLMLTAAIFVL